MQNQQPNPLFAIACGGTGGHLFPGLAVADELLQRGADVQLLISEKEVDQQGVRSAIGMDIEILPAVGLSGGNLLKFGKGFLESRRKAKALFQKRLPRAVLAMGGFTSAPPVMAGRSLGAKTFLHESNYIPGRANKWLAHFVDEAFAFFHEASSQLSLQNISVVGMPVRVDFLEPIDPASAKMALGLKPALPVVLVMGGSQGASGINDLVLRALPHLTRALGTVQFLHLTGPRDVEKVRSAYAENKVSAVVRPFLTEMHFAMRAASVAISRSGASSLAELAAVQLPAVLIPYPSSADDHQFYNALKFVESGAARMTSQHGADPERLALELKELKQSTDARARMQSALAQWHAPDAAKKIAERIFTASEPSTGRDVALRRPPSVSQSAARELHMEEANA